MLPKDPSRFKYSLCFAPVFQSVLLFSPEARYFCFTAMLTFFVSVMHDNDYKQAGQQQILVNKSQQTKGENLDLVKLIYTL